MTRNKAQGQSIDNLKVHLPQPVNSFSHGQLYVVLSRAGMLHKTKAVISNIKDIQGTFQDHIGKCTKNVAYSEILN